MYIWGNNSLRPDVVLRQGIKTYRIDTKWKRPNRSSASVNDLRQMYAYCRFWDAEKAMLLYPGGKSENKFRPYLTDDYSKDNNANHTEIDHQCKMGFVEVMKGEELNSKLGLEILALLEL
jgi:5-methylcytosine-specific restriction enzyme subunit McrC